jgi:exonuclease III
MIQNCRWTRVWNKKARFDQIRKKVIEKKPDVVCLQELIFANDKKFFQIDGYQQINFTAKLKNKGGLLTLVRSQPSQSYYKNYQKQGRVLSIQIFERFLGKGFLATYLEDVDTWIVNTHLQAVHNIFEKHDHVQEKQLEELLEFINSKDKVILCGDLNFTPFSKNYKTITHSLKDLSSVNRSTYIKKAQKLDYIMSRGINCEINEREFFYYSDSNLRVSDHVGIYINIQKKRNPIIEYFEYPNIIERVVEFANKF